MQISQVSLINHKTLQQSLGLFNKDQKLLVNSPNILPLAFLLLPSVVQAQTLDNFYGGQQLNNLNLLNGVELFDAEGITKGLPKLWLGADDISDNINVESKFSPSGDELIPETPFSAPLHGIASTLIADGSPASEILSSEVFKDSNNSENISGDISGNSGNYQTINEPEIPDIYADENPREIAIKTDNTVFKETVYPAEISAQQEIPFQFNLKPWSGLTIERSVFPSNSSSLVNKYEIYDYEAAFANKNSPIITGNNNPEIEAEIEPEIEPEIEQKPALNPIGKNLRFWSGLPSEFYPDRQNPPTVNQKPEAKSANWSEPVVLDPIATTRTPQYLQKNIRPWSGLPPEFIPENREENSMSEIKNAAAEFPNQIQPENNSYTIQAKVLTPPVSDFNYQTYWSKVYSSLINRDLQESLAAIALETNSHPGVVYVLASADYLELMLLSPGQPVIRRIIYHTNRDLLNATIQELIADVTNPRILGSDRYLSSAQQLYQWLISPIEAELSDRGIDTLMFSLAPNIRSLPLAVLHDGQQFLVEKYRLSLIPSLNLTDLSYQNLSHSKVLAMGASKFADPKIQPLDQVPLELSAIAQNLPGQLFINEAFTPENFKYQTERGNYQIVHLATHVEFNPENTQNSYIQFWNRRLTWREIQQIGWQNQPLELLVMSGCETAFGSPNAELGFAGLAIQNGVKSVLASLWQVNDQSTFGLMSEFYRHLNSKSQTIKAEALRQAQLAMLQGKIQIQNGQLTWVDDEPQTYSQSLMGEIGLNHQPENISSQTEIKTEIKNLAHPYFWAAFTLVGNPW